MAFSLADLEESSGVEFGTTGWQGLSRAERRRLREQFGGTRRQFRQKVKQPGRAAGRIGLDVTPETGARYEAYQETIDELKERLNRETGAAIREETVSQLEQAERMGGAPGATEAIGRYATEMRGRQAEIGADVQKELEMGWIEEQGLIEEAIRNEVMRGKKATGGAIGTGIGAAVGLGVDILAGGATGGAGTVTGAKLGSMIGGGGKKDEYAAAVDDYLRQLEEETAAFEELMKGLGDISLGGGKPLTAAAEPAGSSMYDPYKHGFGGATDYYGGY